MMEKSPSLCMKVWLHGALALLIALAPISASAQSPAPTTPQTPAEQQTEQGSQTSAPPANSQGRPPIPQQENPKVKPGSKDDVEAIGNRDVGNGLNFYSLEREMALGKALAQEVERSAKLVDDPIVSEYVNRVGQNLVRNSDARVPFTIKVIDSDAVNAFALPGGFFYVNSGLMLRAESEAELSGVMAHEIAHVAARHSTKRETRSQLTQLATIPLILLGPGGWAGYGIYQGLNFAIPLSFLKFSRNDEREADHLGLEYMYKTGYDPNAFVTFFEKVQAEEKRRPGTIPAVFNSHPPTPDRIENVQKAIGTILPARDQYIVTTSEFDAVKERLMRLQNRNKLQEQRSDRPTLRTRTERAPTTGGQGQPPSTGTSDPTADDPDRPRLERRPDDPNQQ
jgi:predicted Zn-dependent protease